MAVARTGANFPNKVFVPEIWSLKLQAKFYASTVLDQIANTDWEGDIKNKGDKVMIRVIPDVVISDYTVNGTISYQSINDEKLELTIDHAKTYAFKLDDVDAVQQDVAAMNMLTQDAAQQMKIKVDKHVLSGVHASVAAANVISSVQITASVVLNNILKAGTLLDEANAPEEGRWGVLPPWIIEMIKLSDIKQAYLTGDKVSPLRNGKVGMIDRFMIYSSNNLDKVGDDYKCLFGTRHGITFASQFVKHETLRLENTFGDAIRGLNVYGFKVVKDTALVLGNFKK